jgi:hypothetical protein
MTEWANFFVAVAGASAALAGLIFVGISISLKKILEFPKLADRGLESLILLMNILLTASLGLVPHQGPEALGIEVTALGVITWVMISWLDRSMIRATDAQWKVHYLRNMLYNQVAIVPYIVGGIVLVTSGVSGLFWILPGILGSFIKALMDAWVLLVEIHR